MEKINFILPSYPNKPGGGTKIMYEYANRLAGKGYEVTVLHSIKRPFKNSRTPIWLRFILIRLRKKPSWFRFDPAVKIKVVSEISDDTVPDAAVTIATWWQMAFAIAKLSPSKGKKINLIQDYEIWVGQVEHVHESYALPIEHIVIAKYLQKKVLEIAGSKATHIPNAIDTSIFSLKTDIQNRNPKSIIMLYSKEERKGSVFGLAALKKVKEKYPSVCVTLFSVFERPRDLPDWISYSYRPGNLPALYNEHAIFFSPSLGEGWALPPAEAMACGCAVVCTDIGGHHDYAIHEQTALLASPENVNQMAESLCNLIEFQSLRIRLAQSGYENITSQFSWENSVRKMEVSMGLID